MLSFFPRDVLDEILNLIESVSEGFPNLFLKKISEEPLMPGSLYVAYSYTLDVD